VINFPAGQKKNKLSDNKTSKRNSGHTSRSSLLPPQSSLSPAYIYIQSAIQSKNFPSCVKKDDEKIDDYHEYYNMTNNKTTISFITSFSFLPFHTTKSSYIQTCRTKQRSYHSTNTLFSIYFILCKEATLSVLTRSSSSSSLHHRRKSCSSSTTHSYTLQSNHVSPPCLFFSIHTIHGATFRKKSALYMSFFF